jgi:hypothetical protein
MSTHTPKKITEVYLFVSTEPDGGEGVPAFSSNGIMFPLIAADGERLESLMRKAQEISDASGTTMRIMKCGSMQQIGTITPRQPSRNGQPGAARPGEPKL